MLYQLSYRGRPRLAYDKPACRASIGRVLHRPRLGYRVAAGTGSRVQRSMQVVFHLGAPCTDAGLLLQSLTKNRTRLADDGILIPSQPATARCCVDTVRALKGQPASFDVAGGAARRHHRRGAGRPADLFDPRFVCINRLVVQARADLADDRPPGRQL